ncbi:AAA domain-containing protein [Spinellus fusiger]|nr:AAA domain-containing protein [Spinellus fusiger]
MEKFIEHQISLVKNEQKIDIEETFKLLSTYAPIQLQKRGMALVGLKVTDLELAHPTKLPAVFPTHKITTGDIVGTPQLSGVVFRVTDAKVTIALSQDKDDELSSEIQEHCQMQMCICSVKLANSVTYERMIKSLERIKALGESGVSEMAKTLLGLSKPSAPIDQSDIVFYDETLNESQKDAVRFALGAPEIALVHGPPDNLVERLARHRMNLVRVGHPARILPTVLEHSLDIITRTCDSGQIVAEIRQEMDETLGKIKKCKNRSERRALYSHVKDLRKDYRLREQRVVEEVITGSQVLISTLNGCGSRNMFKREFDVVIIDEATQALEGRRSPSITSYYQITSQNFQYRMHQKIMEFSSKELYDNKLVADSSVAEHLLTDLQDIQSSDTTQVPLVMIDTSDTGLAHEVTDEAKEELSKANEREVELVVQHVQILLDDGLKQDQIGIITPYSAQVTRLIREIREKWPLIEIGTVDGFQGREKEAILLSLVRSNDDCEVGFLGEKRRLNGSND